MATERIEIDPTELSEYTGGRHTPPAPYLQKGDRVVFTANHGARMEGKYTHTDAWGLAVVRIGKHMVYHVAKNRLEVI